MIRTLPWQEVNVILRTYTNSFGLVTVWHTSIDKTSLPKVPFYPIKPNPTAPGHSLHYLRETADLHCSDYSTVHFCRGWSPLPLISLFATNPNLTVKHKDYFFRVPRFYSLPRHGGSSGSRKSNVFSDFCRNCMHLVHRRIHRQNTHIHKTKTKYISFIF